MPRGRPKGIKLTEDQKAAMQAGRNKAKAQKIALGLFLRTSHKNKIQESHGKPKLYITGNEKDALDFFPAIRNSLRPQHRYKECSDLCIEIAKMPTWQNVRLVLNRLEDIFSIVERTGPVKVVKVIKERKKRVLTPEHIAAMWAGRRK
jgi:hypothetical protein